MNLVLLRGANVGGHNRFSPKALVAKLADLDVTSLGAAGTFVVRGRIDAAGLRDRFRRELPFEVEVIVVKPRRLDPPTGGRPFVSVLAKRPRRVRLPFHAPSKRDWQTRVDRVEGRIVLSVWRRRGKTLVYPNEVVERLFGVPATTRAWSTYEAVACGS